MTDCPIPMRRADVEPDHQAASIVAAVLKLTRLAFTDNPVGAIKGFPDPPEKPVVPLERCFGTELDRCDPVVVEPTGAENDDALFETDTPLLTEPQPLSLPKASGCESRGSACKPSHEYPSAQTAGTDSDTQPPSGVPETVLAKQPQVEVTRVHSTPGGSSLAPSSNPEMLSRTTAVAKDASTPDVLSLENSVAQAILERRKADSSVKPLKPTVVCVSKLPRTDRRKCEATCRAFGFELATGFDSTDWPTVVVTKLNQNGEVAEYSFVTLMALLQRVPIVGHEWLFDMERRKREMQQDRYLAKVFYPDPGKRIFDGVLAVNEMERGSEVEIEFTRLLIAGGCRVADEEQFAVECEKDSWHWRLRVMPDCAETPASWSVPLSDSEATKVGTEFLTLSIIQGRFPPIEESEEGSPL